MKYLIWYMIYDQIDKNKKCALTSHECVAMTSQGMNFWVDRALAGVTLLRDLSYSWSCPLHCGSSLVPSFVAGLSSGLLVGSLLGFYLACWLFRPGPSPLPPRPSEFPRAPSRSQLRGYLHEWSADHDPFGWFWGLSHCCVWPFVCDSADQGFAALCFGLSWLGGLHRSILARWISFCLCPRNHWGILSYCWGGSSWVAPILPWSCPRVVVSYCDTWDPCLACLSSWILGQVFVAVQHSSVAFYRAACGPSRLALDCSQDKGLGAPGQIRLVVWFWEVLQSGNCWDPPDFFVVGRVRDLLRWGCHQGPHGDPMEKSSLRFAADGDYGLLIFTVPAEIAAQSTEVLCYAFPVCKRRGGLTLAVPLAALNSEVLIDNMQREDAGLVGPSKSFSKPLMIEDEEGQVNATTSTCRFMVVDFGDDVLPFLQDYETFDPDSADSVIPFDVDQPAGVPSAEDLVEEVKQRAVTENSGRANFYSAREEQEEDPVVKASAKGAPKKSTQKRLSNAAIMEQVTQLTAAVQALTAKQEEMSRGGLIQNAAASASHAKDPQFGGGRSLVAPQMPGVAESLGIGLSGKSPPTMQIQKALSLVGPPPKVKPVQSEAAQADTFPEDELKHWSTPLWWMLWLSRARLWQLLWRTSPTATLCQTLPAEGD